MRRLAPLALLALHACAPQGPATASTDASCALDAAPGVFVALERDFADFTRWYSVDLGGIAVAGHRPGERVGYVTAPCGLRDGRFPVGTRIVKAIAVDGMPGVFDYVAMAKRGGGFNAGGAEGWEFFELAVSDAGAVSILARGEAPASDQSHLYSGLGVPCNTCHGAVGTEAYDHVLSVGLRPDALMDAGLR